MINWYNIKIQSLLSEWQSLIENNNVHDALLKMQSINDYKLMRSQRSN